MELTQILLCVLVAAPGLAFLGLALGWLLGVEPKERGIAVVTKVALGASLGCFAALAVLAVPQRQISSAVSRSAKNQLPGACRLDDAGFVPHSGPCDGADVAVCERAVDAALLSSAAFGRRRAALAGWGALRHVAAVGLAIVAVPVCHGSRAFG